MIRNDDSFNWIYETYDKYYGKLPNRVKNLLLLIVIGVVFMFSHYYDCQLTVAHPAVVDHTFLRFSFPYLTEDDPMVIKVESNNTDLSCQYAGRPTCCALTEGNMSSEIYPRKHEEVKYSVRLSNCDIRREYISSPYELKHLSRASEIDKIDHEDIRREELLQFMFDDIPHANRWLKRIKYHSHLASSPLPNEDDFEYLSRFKVTRTCGTNFRHEYSWYEWIEPLTVYARHPFSYTKCPPYGFQVQSNQDIYHRGRTQHIDYDPELVNLDYLILQNQLELNESHRYAAARRHHVPKRYLFDAGASTFDSSITWFLCSYLQVMYCLPTI